MEGDKTIKNNTDTLIVKDTTSTLSLKSELDPINLPTELDDPDLLLAMEMEKEINNLDDELNALQLNKETTEPIQEKRKQKNPNKCDCDGCNKKLSMLDKSVNKCKCERIFCPAHRYSDLHNCEYDWKSHDRSILKQNNIKVVTEKLNRI